MISSLEPQRGPKEGRRHPSRGSRGSAHLAAAPVMLLLLLLQLLLFAGCISRVSANWWGHGGASGGGGWRQGRATRYGESHQSRRSALLFVRLVAALPVGVMFGGHVS